MGGNWNIIAGNSTSLSGFTYSGGIWISNDSLVSGLSNESCSPAPTVFYYGVPYLVSGNCTGDFSGYYWNGTDWEADSYIVSGLLNTGAFASPYAYYNNSNLNLVTGKGNGQFSGYNWNGTEWLPNATLTSGLTPAASRSAPAVFQIDSVKTKTITYATRFVLEQMGEYPNAGSQCFQNKTQIIIPEGTACTVNVYANITHGWGVRLKTTTLSILLFFHCYL